MSLRADFKHSRRLFHIAKVLARHDALFGLEQLGIAPDLVGFIRLFANRKDDRRPGEKLATALQSLGPTFIKLGQALSTRSDLVGDEMAHDLAHLRDSLPEFPWKQAKAIIEEDLATPIDQLFAHIDEQPIAAASMAQVHFATLHDGRNVAVKVLRPNVAEQFHNDLELFYWLAGKAEGRLTNWRRLKPRQVVDTLADSIRMELDLRFEASAAVELRENMRDNPHFYVPNVIWTHTYERVLVTERIYGVKISDIDSITKLGFDTDEILLHAATDFFAQVFRDGFFHADLHPGNCFLMPDGRLGVVDFGIMGRLDKQNRIWLADILRGFLSEDYDLVAKTHFDAGLVPRHKSYESFRLACMAVAKPVLDKPVSEISVARLLGQLFSVAEQFEMETQPHLLMLQKTMMLAEGMGRMLNPNVNMWKMAEPLITRWAEENLNAAARLQVATKRIADQLQQAPEMADRFASLLKETEIRGFRLHPETLIAVEEARNKRHRSWLWLGWAALAAGIVIAIELL